MTNMTHKETDMFNILQRKDLDDTEKQKMYNANLERFLHLRHQQDKKLPTVQMKPEGKEESKTQLLDATIVGQ